MSLRRLLFAFAHLANRFGGAESPWDRVPMPVPAGVFGPGSRRQFADYFQGESSVRVTSVDDIVEWLHRCEYVSDVDLFHERDVWQHPNDFEQRRRGDCEDFALWAWRKLGEIDVDAEFYVGCVRCGEPAVDRPHAWVVYRADDHEFLFEPAASTRERMIRVLADVMDQYVPHFAVDRRLATFAFVGCLLASHA